MATKSLPARLRRVLRETGWSQADLAAVTGASASTVSRWLSDGPQAIDSHYAFRIQDASGFCARWLLHEEGPVHAAEPLLDQVPARLRFELLRHLRSMVQIFRETTQQ